MNRTWIDLGKPALLEFSGPDVVRFLNGQVTQDVSKVKHNEISLSSCITDAKGKLQFRVALTQSHNATLWVSGDRVWEEALEARLTRYLIADDVEVTNLSGKLRLIHCIGDSFGIPADGMARKSARYGIDGWDVWIPADKEWIMPEDWKLLEGDALEAFRIRQGIPLFGKELTEGMLPPEAGLEASDISYHKGCYIGQEVISRIKSAGKVNRRLVRLALPEDSPATPGELLDETGAKAGEVTSISPQTGNGTKLALGYLKRNAESTGLSMIAGNTLWPVEVLQA